MQRIAFVVLLVATLAVTGCSRDLVVLLPDDSGHVGQLSRSSDAGEVVLDQAYSAAASGDTTTRTMEVDEVQSLFGEAIAAEPPAPETFVLYFKEGTTTLEPESEAEFERMREAVAQHPAPEVQVTGHTDRLGNGPDNDRLSALRAATVRGVLLQQGIESHRVSAIGRGEREPLVATEDGVREPRNRRVEITVR